MWLENNSKKQWVTLVEVIFAILIFWTWILVILSMITQNIRWIYDIKEKDTALAIAKEWIDIVYHLRDSNLERGLFWDCAEIDLSEPNACWSYFYDNSGITKYRVNFDKDALYTMEPITVASQAEIYYHTWTLYTFSWTNVEWFWYNHDPIWWEFSQYLRHIEFRPLAWYEAFTWFVLELTSRVSYMRWDELEEVVLQSVIWNIR